MTTKLVCIISEATGLLNTLASIIEHYDGRDDLKRILIQSTCREYQCVLFDHPWYTRLTRLSIDFKPCELFPFCKHTILGCLGCKFTLRFIMSDIFNRDRFGPYLDDDDLLINEMSVDETLMWMINGGIAWTIPLMDEDLANRINNLMSFAYTSLCTRIAARK